MRNILPFVETHDRSEWIAKLRGLYREHLRSETLRRETPSNLIHSARLIALVQEAAGDNCLYVVDGGDTSYFGMTGLRASEGSGVLVPSRGLFGRLGTGIPFGIAAKLAQPERTVVVINGDGSFGFNAMEFDSAVRHRLPFVCVINNDCAWGMMKHGQEMTLGADHVQCADLGERRYEKMVEGLGGYGECVTAEEDIAPAIKRAVASGRPACVNVFTDPSVTSPATFLFEQSLQV